MFSRSNVRSSGWAADDSESTWVEVGGLLLAVPGALRSEIQRNRAGRRRERRGDQCTHAREQSPRPILDCHQPFYELLGLQRSSSQRVRGAEELSIYVDTTVICRRKEAPMNPLCERAGPIGTLYNRPARSWPASRGAECTGKEGQSWRARRVRLL